MGNKLSIFSCIKLARLMLKWCLLTFFYNSYSVILSGWAINKQGAGYITVYIQFIRLEAISFLNASFEVLCLNYDIYGHFVVFYFINTTKINIIFFYIKNSIKLYLVDFQVINHFDPSGAAKMFLGLVWLMAHVYKLNCRILFYFGDKY